MLSLLNTRYGNATYEDRYLILMYCASMLIFVALLSQSGLRRWLVRALVAAFALCLLVRTAAADAAYTATRIRTGLMDAISSTAASLPSPVVFTCTVTDEYNLMMRNMRCYNLSHVYKPIRSGEEDSLTLNERYRDEADAQGIAWNDNFDHWGDCIYYDNADDYAGPITLLAEPACFEALPDSLRSEFTFYAALNDDLAVYTCNENLLGCNFLPHQKTGCVPVMGRTRLLFTLSFLPSRSLPPPAFPSARGSGWAGQGYHRRPGLRHGRIGRRPGVRRRPCRRQYLRWRRHRSQPARPP